MIQLDLIQTDENLTDSCAISHTAFLLNITAGIFLENSTTIPIVVGFSVTYKLTLSTKSPFQLEVLIGLTWY